MLGRDCAFCDRFAIFAQRAHVVTFDRAQCARSCRRSELISSMMTRGGRESPPPPPKGPPEKKKKPAVSWGSSPNNHHPALSASTETRPDNRARHRFCEVFRRGSGTEGAHRGREFLEIDRPDYKVGPLYTVAWFESQGRRFPCAGKEVNNSLTAVSKATFWSPQPYARRRRPESIGACRQSNVAVARAPSRFTTSLPPPLTKQGGVCVGTSRRSHSCQHALPASRMLWSLRENAGSQCQ